MDEVERWKTSSDSLPLPPTCPLRHFLLCLGAALLTDFPATPFPQFVVFTTPALFTAIPVRTSSPVACRRPQRKTRTPRQPLCVSGQQQYPWRPQVLDDNHARSLRRCHPDYGGGRRGTRDHSNRTVGRRSGPGKHERGTSFCLCGNQRRLWSITYVISRRADLAESNDAGTDEAKPRDCRVGLRATFHATD